MMETEYSYEVAQVTSTRLNEADYEAHNLPWWWSDYKYTTDLPTKIFLLSELDSMYGDQTHLF